MACIRRGVWVGGRLWGRGVKSNSVEGKNFRTKIIAQHYTEACRVMLVFLLCIIFSEFFGDRAPPRLTELTYYAPLDLFLN